MSADLFSAPESHGSYDALVPLALEVIQVAPMGAQIRRGKDMSMDFNATVVNDQAWIPNFRSPAGVIRPG